MKLTWWKRSLILAVAVVGALAAVVAQPRLGRSAEPPPPPEGQVFKYKGSANCRSCHSVTKENPSNNYPESAKFIKLNESATWEKDDKHSIAFQQLSSDRGRRMASLLKVDVTRREAGCLGCHSASTSEVKDRQGDQYKPSEGVSCENCHGPSSAWFGDHLEMSFRGKSTQEWAKDGFVDLRTPEGEADKCLSCHIGRVSEGKVVTHDMYAAGHPPLPSIEVATFANSIPRHWWLLSEREDPEVRKQIGYVAGQLEQTRLAIVGAAVALRTSMELLADEARSTAKAGGPGEEWPDYARFDCWSCHHDLKRESWRQARGFQGGPPGRVPVGEWPLALVELGIEHLVAVDPAAGVLRSDLQEFEKVLHDKAYARPFGQKEALAQAARRLASWSGPLIARLSKANYDKPAAARLLRKLVERAEATTPDFDSARHVAWTIKLIVGELGDQVKDREKVDVVLRKFEEGLNLNLPAGRNFEIEKQLGNALRAIGDYEPADFQRHLRELLALLPAS